MRLNIVIQAQRQKAIVAPPISLRKKALARRVYVYSVVYIKNKKIDRGLSIPDAKECVKDRRECMETYCWGAT